MTRHEITLWWSADDDAFIAEVPELAGCMADGATRQEALTNAEVVIAEWLETAKTFQLGADRFPSQEVASFTFA